MYVISIASVSNSGKKRPEKTFKLAVMKDTNYIVEKIYSWSSNRTD